MQGLLPRARFITALAIYLSFLFHISLSSYSAPKTGSHKKRVGIIAQPIYYPHFRVIVVTVL